jgi:hypothetical protein
MISAPNLDHIKTSVDMLDLASRYTKLRRKTTRGEFHGPCPQCGGSKRFVVHTDGWWFCRDCHEKRGDAIELVRFVEGVDFVTACERLGAFRVEPRPARPRMPAPTPKAHHWDTPRWQQQAYELMDDAAAALERPIGAPGRAYLEQRGITPTTWRMWLLGYARSSPPWNKDVRRRVGGPSIIIPYLRHDDDRIMAVRYRRIDPEADRYINEAGSACVLHGLHLINLNAPTLLLVEGELNAISSWQAAHDRGVSVVSIGSQSMGEHTVQGISWLSAQFPRCIVWCDEPAKALQVRAAVRSPQVLPLQSPKPGGTKIDANDLLQQGLLRPFLERKLALLAAGA